jgi:titin
VTDNANENDIGPGNIISGNGSDGVVFQGNGNTIRGNLVGTTADGSSGLGNAGTGIAVRASSQGNAIGGIQPGEQNVISGNGSSGIAIYDPGTSENAVSGNLVGTDAAGANPIPNGTIGVAIFGAATSNTIGPDNVISGNTNHGVYISGPNTTGNTIHDNLIGTDATGTTAVPNGAPGVSVTNEASDNTIGPRNVISGNDSEGMVLEYGAHDNHVIGNKVGTDVSESSAIQNYWSGVLVQFGGHHNTIGGPQPGDGNVCSGNRASGITIRDEGSDFNVLIGNRCGTNLDGSAAVPNGSHGVNIYDGASHNVVGPVNVVTLNTTHGVRIAGAATVGNTITQNFITGNTSPVCKDF